MLAAVILSQGIPFIHSGQEFFRTKNCLPNTYNAGDQVNALDWYRKDCENATVEFVQFLIHLRKNNPCFRYDSYDMIHKNVKMDNIAHRMIKYSLHQENAEYSDIIVYFNASSDSIEEPVEEGYKVLYHTDKKEIMYQKLSITGISIVILAR